MRQLQKSTNVLGYLCLALIMISCQPEEEVPKPYNILFIAVDDLRTELNCYGATHIKSPNIDKLAGSGIRFTNAHVQQAICMASRASILSGIRPEKRGIYTGESVDKTMPDVLTMNQFFEQNGYAIASTGKIYHYKEDTEKQFGDAYIEPKPTWEAKGYVTEKAIEEIQLTSKPGNGPPYESAKVHDTIYPDGLNTLNAIRSLEELKDGGKPFFMAVGLVKPHLPFNAPQKYWDMYPDESINLSELTERPENTSKYTVRPGGELSNYYKMPKLFKDVQDSTALTLRRGYYACVSYIDAQIGKLVAKLEALDLRENTIIVLWGDHGYKLGDYNSWCKWSNMNIDTQVPLIFDVPGGKEDAEHQQPVEALDVYPTLADLCGFKLPQHLEGKSLAYLWDGSKQIPPEKAYAYSIWPDNRWNYDKTIMGYSVTDDRFNYVEWVKLDTGEVLERELYDHEKDPNEIRNAVSEAEYNDVIAELAKKVQERKQATDHDHHFKNLR